MPRRCRRRLLGNVRRYASVNSRTTGGGIMTHFFFKLLPPRPSFPQDMTEAERELM